MLVLLFMGGVVAALAAAALRARRTVRTPADDTDLIEARNIGGHSWVAYGWDSRR